MNRRTEPLTICILRVLYRANSPLTRAQLLHRLRVHAATEITRPLRDLRKPHPTWCGWCQAGANHTPCTGLGLAVPCTKDAAGRPAYWLTTVDRDLAGLILARNERSAQRAKKAA